MFCIVNRLLDGRMSVGVQLAGVNSHPCCVNIGDLWDSGGSWGSGIGSMVPSH